MADAVTRVKAFVGAALRGRLARGVLSSAALVAAVLWSTRASAQTNPARVIVDISVRAIQNITSLQAQTNAGAGAVTLTWTEPLKNGHTGPETYEIRVSSTGQISNTGAFNAAQPLSSFSPSPVPAPGPGGGVAAFVVTGLEPGVTYYFAMREKDSSVPALQGAWNRNVPQNWNVNNAARAGFANAAPNPVTDLAANITGALGQARLQWTVPAVPPDSPRLKQYVLKYSSVSAADLAGDTTAWFNLESSTAVYIAAPSTVPAGALREHFVNGLSQGTTYFFGIKAENLVGLRSDIDAKTAGIGTQANVRLGEPIEIVAAPGPASGSVDLSWTEPFTAGLVFPVKYVIKASSMANIENELAFEAASPLSALSESAVPTPGTGGTPLVFNITGLTPNVTYYFALRLEDSNVPFAKTPWFRSVGAGVNEANFAPARFHAGYPDAITDLTALEGTQEGEIQLSWTAPKNPNFVPLSRYDVRFATFSVASLAGDTTAWFNLASSASTVGHLGRPGTPQSLLVADLFPSSTYYFGVKAIDVYDEIGYLDARAVLGPQTRRKPKNLPPGTPSGLTLGAGLNRASAVWNELPASQTGRDFAGYRLYRSTEQAASFVLSTATFRTDFLDRPLTPFVSYYFKISAIDSEGLESVHSSTVAVMPYTLPPQEPFGFVVTPGPTQMTLEWNKTERYADSTMFIDPQSPVADELLGYQVLRSTDVCAPFSLLTVKPVSQSSHTDTHNGTGYYYKVQGFNTLGTSTSSVMLDVFGRQVYTADDCINRALVDNKLTEVLSSTYNAYGQDILLSVRRRSEDTGGKILQSVEFRPLLNGETEIKGFHFAKPIQIQLHFVTQGGVPVPQTAGYPAQGAAPQQGAYNVSAGEAAKNLGLFWNNGIEFKKLYGKVDPVAQTVVAETPNVGQFQIRTVFRDSAVTFDISNITSRVFTPNSDGLNDSVIFVFDNPRASFVEGKVYDMRGAFVAHMTAGPQPDSLMWDGRMNGRVVTSGVYLYEIKAEGKTFNGTVVVAR